MAVIRGIAEEIERKRLQENWMDWKSDDDCCAFYLFCVIIDILKLFWPKSNIH